MLKSNGYGLCHNRLLNLHPKVAHDVTKSNQQTALCVAIHVLKFNGHVVIVTYATKPNQPFTGASI